MPFVFATKTMEVLGLVGSMLGVLAAVVIPWIVYNASKRSKEWATIQTEVGALKISVNTLQTQSNNVHEKIGGLETRTSTMAERSNLDDLRQQFEKGVEDLRKSLDGLRDAHSSMHKEYVTEQQYQRDIAAFEKYVQLLRETIQQQTDVLNALRRSG